MTPDSLDAKSDAELNQLFSVEVVRRRFDQTVAYGWRDSKGARRPTAEWPENFCADANAVLFWLENWHRENPMNRSIEISRAGNCRMDWFITLVIENEEQKYDYSMGTASTFARAACLSLIRAKRASK